LTYTSIEPPCRAEHFPTKFNPIGTDLKSTPQFSAKNSLRLLKQPPESTPATNTASMIGRKNLYLSARMKFKINGSTTNTASNTYHGDHLEKQMSNDRHALAPLPDPP